MTQVNPFERAKISPLQRAVTRRQLIGFSAAAAGLIALPGCSGDDGGGQAGEAAVDFEGKKTAAMESFAADTPFKASEPFTLTMLWTDWPDLPVKDSWEIFAEIEKRTGVTLKLTHIPFSDAEEKRSLLISAGDAPTVIPLVYTGQEQPFVASGAVLAMSDYVEHMPNFGKYVEEWDLQSMIDNLKQSDGKYYMVPGLQEVSVPVFSVVVRKDVFESVAGGIPETWDEMREALLKIKQEYPNSKPLADGFEGMSMINYASHAWGCKAGWGFGDGIVANDAGELVYTAVTDSYRQMVEYFHGLYADGLLDGESFTQADAGGGAESTAEKFAQEKIFAASGSSGTAADLGTALDETVGEGNYEVTLIAPPGGPAGQQVEPRNFWHGFMLNSEITESENFLATLQFLDWFYYSPDARELLRWGVEDHTYTKDSGGKVTLKPEYSYDAMKINPKGKTDLQVDLGWSTFPAEATESRALKESYNPPEFAEYIDTVLSTRTPRDPYPASPLDEAELEQASLLATPLQDTVDTNTLKFILGQRDLSEWDAFVQELEGQGLQQYLDLKKTAHQRFKDNNG
jgi:putative aldouronate transport system substrate-binding protein